jgi:hypothetical protein
MRDLQGHADNRSPGTFAFRGIQGSVGRATRLMFSADLAEYSRVFAIEDRDV